MKKRILSLAVAMTLAVSLLAAYTPAAEAYSIGPHNIGNGIQWEINTDTGDLIIRNIATTNVAISDYTNGRSPWYDYRAHVKRIVLEDRITAIGSSAFSDFGNLNAVVIKSTAITRIGSYAFSGCSNLTGFVSDGGSTWSFGSLTNIDNNAFEKCAGLVSLNIPVVSYVGYDVFLGCKSLNVLSGPTGGRYQTIADGGVLAEMDGANTVPVRMIKAPVSISGVSGRYTIPGSVAVIEAEAFAYCKDLKEIVIPQSVTTIRNNAFAWGGWLEKATFLGNAPSLSLFGTGVFDGANVNNAFFIQFLSGNTGWTTPAWQGYPSRVAASYVTLNKTSLVIEAGKTEQIQATVYPATASQSVTWKIEESSMILADGTPPGTDNHVAGVNVSGVSGVVHGLKPGTATLTVSDTNGYTTTCFIEVVGRGVPVTGVSLDRTVITMAVGDTQLPVLNAAVQPAGASYRVLIWSSSDTNIAYLASTGLGDNQRAIVAVAPGTTMITVSTADGNKIATCTVTVVGAPAFVPVTGVSLSTTTVARGALLDLNDVVTVYPSNATYNKVDKWELISAPTGTTFNAGILSPSWNSTGSIVVEATVTNGLADSSVSNGWGYPESVDYVMRFTINIVQFLPATGITGVPSQAYVGIPLTLTGTVLPANASSRNIKWKIENGGETGAYIDPINGTLVAQKSGNLTVSATIDNAALSGTELTAQFWTFNIYVLPYSPNTLTLWAEPGGSVSGAGAGLFAGNEIVTITATPNVGYVFSGWYSSNGGFFANAGDSVTAFTMPGNSTTVTAYFSYTGLPGGGVGGGGGGVNLPTPVHYFTYGTTYTKSSGVSFAHVTLRSYNLFSRVELDGNTLTRYSHYNAESSDGYTVVTLANGYLDTLSQGPHSLTIVFTDGITVSAGFSVTSTSYSSQSFDDVYTTDWYYADVVFVANRGWMTGRASQPRQFAPHSPVTQGEVLDAFYYVAGRPSVTSVSGAVLQGRDAALQWALSAGITPIGGAYNLSSAISRQDIALLFTKLASSQNLRFPVIRGAVAFADEQSINTAARSAVTTLYRAGIVNGRASNMFTPLGNMTRAEFAAVLHRFSLAVQ